MNVFDKIFKKRPSSEQIYTYQFATKLPYPMNVTVVSKLPPVTCELCRCIYIPKHKDLNPIKRTYDMLGDSYVRDNNGFIQATCDCPVCEHKHNKVKFPEEKNDWDQSN